MSLTSQWWIPEDRATLLKDTTSLLLFGQPGTGKSTEIIRLISVQVDALIQDYGMTAEEALQSIMFVSYTRNGAQVGKERMEQTFSIPAERVPYFRTLHSICLRLLALSADDLVTSSWLSDFGLAHRLPFSPSYLSASALRATPYSYDDTPLSPFDTDSIGDWCMGCWDLARNRCSPYLETVLDIARDRHPPRSVRDEAIPDLLHSFVTSYEQSKREAGRLDYTDWLITVLTQGSIPQVTTIYADEAQDFSLLHWRVLLRWASRQYNPLIETLVVAGDDDQSTFVWNGADPVSLITLPTTYQDVLGQSYRLPRRVHAFSQEIITRNIVRAPKTFAPSTVQGDGLVTTAHDISEIDFSPTATYFLLVRNRIFGKPILEHLVQLHLPFRNRTSPFDPLAPSPLLAATRALWLLAHDQPITEEQLLSLCSNMPSTLSDGTRLFTYGTKSHLRSLLATRTLTSLDLIPPHVLTDYGATASFFDLLADRNPYQYLRADPTIITYLASLLDYYPPSVLSDPPHITVSTYHQIKGEQCDHVICYSDMSRRTWDSYISSPEGRESENRIFYVGVTRAFRSATIMLTENQRQFEWPLSLYSHANTSS